MQRCNVREKLSGASLFVGGRGACRSCGMGPFSLFGVWGLIIITGCADKVRSEHALLLLPGVAMCGMVAGRQLGLRYMVCGKR